MIKYYDEYYADGGESDHQSGICGLTLKVT